MISCSCHKFIELSFSFEGTTERFVFFFIYIFLYVQAWKIEATNGAQHRLKLMFLISKMWEYLYKIPTHLKK